MTEKNGTKLETIISYILIGGVMLSVIIECFGLLLYYAETGDIVLSFSSEWQLSGDNFFSYSAQLFSSFIGGVSTIRIMALGIVLLMLTPFLRVIASVTYFGLRRDLTYVLITIFVLVVLTLSLAVH